MTNTKIVNLTPHDITILDSNNNIVSIIASSGNARCDKKTTIIDTINGINVNSVSYGNIVGLPDPTTNTVYIVSVIVATAVKGLRDDCYCVDDVVRDGSTVLGCKALSKV